MNRASITLFWPTVCVSALIMSGCGHKDSEHANAFAAGNPTGATGTVRIRELAHQAYTTHKMSDADLNWTLDLLKKSNNVTARARAMAMISEIHPMTALQKNEIRPVIAPFLNSGNPLDQIGVRRIQKSMAE